MTYYDSKIVKCVNCGRTFMWSANEQKHFNDIGNKDRKYCERCREIRNDYSRSSQVDHPAYPAPPALPTFLPAEPAAAPPPPPKPAVEKRPFWWSNPVHQHTALLWLLIVLDILVLALLLTLLF